MASPSSIRWVDKSQPQTLVTATVILYLNAALGLIFGELWAFFPLGALLVLGQVASALGVANEKKWGYWLGVVLVALFVAYLLFNFGFAAILTLVFYIALLALLLHPQSRSYQKIWFR